MNKNWKFIGLAILFISITVVGLLYTKDLVSSSVTSPVLETSTTTTIADSRHIPNGTDDSKGIVVEVYHFHRTKQCWSCKTLGEFAEKTVNTYFKQEFESGSLKFGHINVELPENKELADKYGATGSSLMIGTYIKDSFTKEENTNVWYKLNNEEDYLNYFKGVLEKRLSGDLS